MHHQFMGFVVFLPFRLSSTELVFAHHRRRCRQHSVSRITVPAGVRYGHALNNTLYSRASDSRQSSSGGEAGRVEMRDLCSRGEKILQLLFCGTRKDDLFLYFNAQFQPSLRSVYDLINSEKTILNDQSHMRLEALDWYRMITGLQ